jgi:hypothetical protein
VIHPRHIQTKLDELARLDLVEGEEPIRHVDPIREALKPFHSLKELHLGKDEDLEQLVFVGLIIQEASQDFDMRSGELLALINDQDNGLVIFDARPEEVSLDLLSVIEDRPSGRLDSQD